MRILLFASLCVVLLVSERVQNLAIFVGVVHRVGLHVFRNESAIRVKTLVVLVVARSYSILLNQGQIGALKLVVNVTCSGLRNVLHHWRWRLGDILSVRLTLHI